MARNDTSENGVPVRSNKFVWCSYDLPPPLSETDIESETDEDAAEFPLAAGTEDQDNDDTRRIPLKEGCATGISNESFTIRHLKQGRTGAVRTWPAAQLLLDYLVRRGGFRDVRDKVSKNGHKNETGVLDLTVEPSSLKEQQCTHQPASSSCNNILELGSGSGYLGIGLALAMNREAGRIAGGAPFQPNVRVLCTDHDKNTIKNMRYNVSQQPKSKRITKAVRVQSLDWGEDVGGQTFSQAVEAQFGDNKRRNRMDEADNDIEHGGDKDPINLLTHLIASDVLFGEATLEPLSDVIASIKLRNPAINVTILQRERSPGHVEELQKAIESKVQNSLLQDEDLSPERQHQKERQASKLDGFCVSVRDVIHEEISNLKIMEC